MVDDTCLNREIATISVKSAGRVVMKISSCMGGENSGAVASSIEALGRIPTVRQARKIASGCGLGGHKDMIILSARGVKRRARNLTGNTLIAAAVQGFEDSNFNPFAGNNTIEYLHEVIL